MQFPSWRLCCIGHNCYRYKSKSAGKLYHAKVAFAVLIRPESYKVGPQTIGEDREIDPGFNNQELEWMTKEQGASILYGILVKLIEH